MRKNWLVGGALVLSAVIAVVGVWHVTLWVSEHPMTTFGMAMGSLLGYYMVAFFSVLLSRDLYVLAEFATRGPLKWLARSKFYQLAKTYSFEALREKIKAVGGCKSLDTPLRTSLIGRLAEIAPDKDMRNEALLHLVPFFASDEAMRNTLVAILEPYTEDQIKKAWSTSELNEVKSLGLVSDGLEALFSQRFEELNGGYVGLARQ